LPVKKWDDGDKSEEEEEVDTIRSSSSRPIHGPTLFDDRIRADAGYGARFPAPK